VLPTVSCRVFTKRRERGHILRWVAELQEASLRWAAEPQEASLRWAAVPQEAISCAGLQSHRP
jgi:hypothetical protein